MLGIIVVPRNAVMIQEREHLFAALLTPFLVFVRQWGGEFSLTHRPQESHCRPLVSTQISALEATAVHSLDNFSQKSPELLRQALQLDSARRLRKCEGDL